MFYAITGIGWGKGETRQEAKQNYLDAQRRNYRGITDEELDDAWGFVWKAPEGATGFALDMVLYWHMEDGSTVKADPSQRVVTIGAVPMSVFRPVDATQ